LPAEISEFVRRAGRDFGQSAGRAPGRPRSRAISPRAIFFAQSLRRPPSCRSLSSA